MGIGIQYMLLVDFLTGLINFTSFYFTSNHLKYNSKFSIKNPNLSGSWFFFNLLNGF